MHTKEIERAVTITNRALAELGNAGLDAAHAIAHERNIVRMMLNGYSHAVEGFYARNSAVGPITIPHLQPVTDEQANALFDELISRPKATAEDDQ